MASCWIKEQSNTTSFLEFVRSCHENLGYRGNQPHIYDERIR